MKTYLVYLTEQVTRTVAVQAEDEGQALILSTDINDRYWDYQDCIVESMEAIQLEVE